MKKLFLASTLAALMTGAVLAQSEPKEAQKAQNAAAGVLPLETILQKSVELYPGGRVVEAELDDDLMRDTYEVEVVDANGVEWDLEFDAKTGEVIERKHDKD